MYLLACFDLAEIESSKGCQKLVSQFDSSRARKKVSQGAKDFIAACLTFKPALRPSIADLLSRDWIQKPEAASDEVLGWDIWQTFGKN